MSTKYEQAFLDIYYSVDKKCCTKFGVESDGVSEYLTKLESARFAPHRNEVLSVLSKCKTLREGATLKNGDPRRYAKLQKSATKWLKSFDSKLKKKNDPLGLYLKKARRYKRWKRIGHFLSVLLIAAIEIAAVCGIAFLIYYFDIIPLLFY